MSEIPLCLLAKALDVNITQLPAEVQNHVWNFLPRPFDATDLRESRRDLTPVTDFHGHPTNPNIAYEPTNYEEDGDYYLRLRFLEDWNDNRVELIAGFLVKKPLVHKCFVKYNHYDFTVYLPYRSEVPFPAKYYPELLVPWSKVAKYGLAGTVFIEGL